MTKCQKPEILFCSLGILALLALAGCGSSSKANVVTVAVSPSTDTVIVSQSVTLTAIVSGSTDTNISSWTCQYQTTSVPTSGSSTMGKLQPCTSATGTIPSNSTALTVTFTAPSQVPDPTKLPGTNCTSSSAACLLSIVITATADANKSKTGTATITLNSGITVTLSPTTATVPTGEQQLFSVALANDLQSQGVTWLVTQGTPTTLSNGTIQNFPALPTCSPGCGSITGNTGLNTATFAAPSTVPSTATVTVVATSKADATRFAVGTITIVQGGPITFNGISPTIAPEGATFYDIYLNAPLISSASVITITPSGGGKPVVINSLSNQFKVLFPIPTTSQANPTSTGARLRLLESNLAVAGTYTISVSDPAEKVTNGAGPFSFDVVPVRATSTASIPDSVIQNGQGNELNLAIDGGYFGPGGLGANTVFNGSSIAQNTDIGSSARRLNLSFLSSAVNSVLPGLYPLTVATATSPAPSPNNPSVTNIAVFPDFSVTPPTVVSASNPAGIGPSAVDIDTRLGILAVAETGSNLVQFFGIGTGSITALACPTSSCVVNAPTGLYINQNNHTVAVVSAQDQSVVVLPLPCPSGSTCTIGAPGVTYPETISLGNLLPSTVNISPVPLPYSVGVDADTNMAIVAYSSNVNPTLAKVGYLLDLNKDSQMCMELPNGTTPTPPCVFAQVTLNTGPYPKIAMVPHTHSALVTPGGSGVLSTIDVTKPSSSLAISSVSLISGLVTVTVTVPTGQTLGLNPGNPGTIVIQGVPKGTTNGVDFNGVFTVQSVLNATSFTYALNSTKNDTATGNSSSMVLFSQPNIVTAISQTSQGISINPITRTAAIADANATGTTPQINLLNGLDQAVTSIIFHSGCTAVQTILSCAGAPELLGTSSVAFQPYTNAVVSYNPQQNQVSVSDPDTQQRYALACNAACNPNPSSNTDLSAYLAQTVLPGGAGTSSVTVNANGASTTLNLFGGLAVDAATNQAFVVQSGAGNIVVVNLRNTTSGPASGIKAAQISDLVVPLPNVPNPPLVGGIPGASLPQGTLTSTSDLAAVQIFGSGFDANTQVRLDGNVAAGPGGSGAISVDPTGRRITFTVPASFLSSPHHYAVDVVNGSGVRSNVTDLFVIKSVDLSTACAGGNAQPSSVAIADQLPGQGFSPIAVVSNSGCGNVSVIDINPANATFGAVKATIATGNDPLGVAVSPRFGLAVVANNASGSASILDLTTNTQKIAAVTVGSNPTGVAIDEGTGAALVANTGSNTVSELNLALLFANGSTAAATTLTPTSIGIDQEPIAVAIDPDRGTNNRGLAVVTALQLVAGSTPVGVLDSVDIGGAVPAKSTTASVGSVTATPTGVVVNPCPFSTVTPAPGFCSASPALFYATSSGGNVVTAFNPDGGTTSSVHVGVNPNSLALNPQTGAIMTVNSSSHTVSIIDTLSNPFATRRNLGLSGSSQFGIAIDQFTNLAVLVDQASNRVLLFPVPN